MTPVLAGQQMAHGARLGTVVMFVPDLDRAEGVLRGRSAYRQTRSSGGVVAVEGRDPDDIVLMITYRGPDQVPMHELPVRIYGW